MPPAPSEQESIWMHFIASGSSIKISSLAHFHILVHFNDNTRCGTRQTMRPSRVKQRDNIWRKEKGTIYFSAYRARCLRVETSRQRQGMITRLLLKNVFFFHGWWPTRTDAFNETAFPSSDAHASSGLIIAHALIWCHLVAHLSSERRDLSEPRRQLLTH